MKLGSQIKNRASLFLNRCMGGRYPHTATAGSTIVDKMKK